jgi:colanic acid/amylovoran biosynthesis glycosyltransferase
MDELRIAYLVNEYPAPSHSFIRREIIALESMDIEVVRFSMRRWRGEFVDPADREELSKTEIILEAGVFAFMTSMLLAMMCSPKGFFRAAKVSIGMGLFGDRGILINLIYLAEASLLLRWARMNGISHVHAHFCTNSTAVAMLCKYLGGPTYSFTVHGAMEFDCISRQSLGLKVKEAKFVVAISQHAKSQICRWCEFKYWSKINVIHCGVDARFLREPSAPDQETTDFICVARLVPQKGLLILIEAIQRIRLHGKKLKLTIIGDGPQAEELRKTIGNFGLEEYIRLAGWMGSEQIGTMILQSRALILPSFSEGLPVVLMESMALRKPVIATWISAVPELVRPGINGWLVPPGCVDALADAILDCLNQPADTLFSMGQAGRDMVLHNHNCNTEAGKLADLFLQGSTLNTSELKTWNVPA